MKNAFRGTILLLAALALFACAKKEEAEVSSPTEVFQGKKDWREKYDPEITLFSSRVMGASDRFDETDPEKRSFEENRWNRVFKEDLGVNLKYSWISPDNNSSIARWSAAIAARDVPDFAEVPDSVFKQLYDAGLTAEYNDIWDAYVTDEYLATLAETDIPMMYLDGKMYGFPGGMRSMWGTTMLFIRQDWMDQLGLKPPESIDDVVEIARKFKEAKPGGPDTIPFLFSNDVTGGVNHQSVDGRWDGFLNGYGAYLNYWLEKDGRLVYSTIQPELRPALMKLQELYKEGLINRDFASLHYLVARESVAAGKAGIYYSGASCVTQGMNTLILNNPQIRTEPWKMLYWAFPVPAKKGDIVNVQTNSPKGMRIFVSNKCANPEAPFKMALMAYHYKTQSPEAYEYYTEGEWGYYRYLPWGNHFTATHWDLYRADAIRIAVETGDLSLVHENGWDSSWETYQSSKRGEYNPSWLMFNGPEGNYTMLYEQFKQGRILFDKYSGLPTDTMALKGDIIRGNLETAMFEVVMGADISVWDAAVAKWVSDGGDKITEEVNAWYAEMKEQFN